MTPIKVTVHGAGTGTCSLSGKEADGLSVTFDDGTVKEAFLSWKSFRQLLALKSNQAGNSESKPPASAPAITPASAAVSAHAVK